MRCGEQGPLVTDLLAQARKGDERSFAMLVDPHRRELHVHCYRMLGSVQDAEDVLQESLLAAWRGLSGFEERSSIRTWLYRIATNRCLNALRATRSRPEVVSMVPSLDPPEPTRLGEVLWLEPYPDSLLDPIDPEVVVVQREAMSLAFIAALQHLPPRQRAVLVLRDVLGFPAREVAAMLDVTQDAVTGALKRARAKAADATQGNEPPPPGSDAERAVVDALTAAYDRGDIDALVALLTDDVWVTMPPLPLEYQGRDLAGTFLRAVSFRDDRTYRLVPTRANGQPAFGAYVQDPHAAVLHAAGLLVIALRGDRICQLTRFDNQILSWFGLPRTLPNM